jgi:hypothetical protein
MGNRRSRCIRFYQNGAYNKDHATFDMLKTNITCLAGYLIDSQLTRCYLLSQVSLYSGHLSISNQNGDVAAASIVSD